MIGDDLINDVGGAQRCGIAAILVRTGKYRYKYIVLRIKIKIQGHSLYSHFFPYTQGQKMNATVK